MRIKGGCNCSAVQFEAMAADHHVYQCHCTICQKASGHSGVAVMIVPNSAFTWTKGADLVAHWKKPKADWESWFCPQCGSPLPGKNDDDHMYIPVGGLDQGAEALKVAHHMWVTSKPDWYCIGDSGVQHPEGFGSGG